MGKVEVAANDGEKSKHISLNDLEEQKNKGGLNSKANDAKGQQKAGNSIDTLYSLFLNHLLRPREWSA
jgi:hypothetical protein